MNINKGLHVGSCLFRLTRSWWQSDRIRVATSEGRILRLATGSFLCVRDRRAEVVGRTVGQGANQSWVVYELEFADSNATLTVGLDHTSDQNTFEYADGDAVSELCESEITVFV